MCSSDLSGIEQFVEVDRQTGELATDRVEQTTSIDRQLGPGHQLGETRHGVQGIAETTDGSSDEPISHRGAARDLHRTSIRHAASLADRLSPRRLRE